VRKLIAVLLFLGLAAGVGVGAQRLLLEREFKTVELALDLDDLLAGSGCKGLADALEFIEPWDVESIVVTADPDGERTLPEVGEMAEALRERGYRVLLKVGKGDESHDITNRRQAGESGSSKTFSVEETAALVSAVEPKVILFGGEQVAGYPYEVAQLASLLKVADLRFGLQEFSGQRGERELASSVPLHVVRVHTIYPKELTRYDVESAAARFLRAVKERSYRLLYVRLWPGDPQAGGSLVETLSSALAALGYSRGPAPYLPPWQSHWMYFVWALAAWAGAVLWLGEVLVDFLDSRLRLLCRLGAAALSVGVVVLYFLVDQILARQALALSAAVTFPLLAVIPQRWAVPPQKNPPQDRGMKVGLAGGTALTGLSRAQVVGWSLRQFLVSTLRAAVGAGGMVAALGDFRFMLKIAEFRGVKAMSILPVLGAAVGAVGFARALGKPMAVRQRWREIPVWARVVLAAAVLGAVVIYVGRTGNFVIPVPELEMRVRVFLERAFVYRPRTKEFLIGHPLLILGFGLYIWGEERLGLACIVPGTIGQISLLNTFAHVHSPLAGSISRSFWGLILGAGMGGALLYAVLSVLGRKRPDLADK